MIPFVRILSYGNVIPTIIEPLINGVVCTLFFKNNRVFARGRYWVDAPVSTNWIEQTPTGQSVDKIFVGQYITYMLCYSTNKIFGYGSSNSQWGMTNNSYNKLDLTAQFNAAGISDISSIKTIKSSSFNSTCVLMNNGDLYFIGSNPSYQFGTTVASYSTLTKTLTNVDDVLYSYGAATSGAQCTFAKLKDGTYRACGGVDANGIPLNRTDSTKRVWTTNTLLNGVKSWSSAGKNLSYIDSNDNLYFIGNSIESQIGNNNAGAVYYSTPTLVASNVDSGMISEYNTYYVLKSDLNTLWFAGSNTYSSLSTTGNTNTVLTFQSYTFGSKILDYSDNIRSGVLIINLADNSKYASGYSGDGRLGTTTTNVVLGSPQTSFPL